MGSAAAANGNPRPASAAGEEATAPAPGTSRPPPAPAPAVPSGGCSGYTVTTVPAPCPRCTPRSSTILPTPATVRASLPAPVPTCTCIPLATPAWLATWRVVSPGRASCVSEVINSGAAVGGAAGWGWRGKVGGGRPHPTPNGAAAANIVSVPSKVGSTMPPAGAAAGAKAVGCAFGSMKVPLRVRGPRRLVVPGGGLGV